MDQHVVLGTVQRDGDLMESRLGLGEAADLLAGGGEGAVKSEDRENPGVFVLPRRGPRQGGDQDVLAGLHFFLGARAA